ncbi:MAG TPA: hypothetical protein HPQ03_02400 [Deltaproteobacteria bacterium]|nr:hypothetical protein [Deltaproteobacteria bacterium]
MSLSFRGGYPKPPDTCLMEGAGGIEPHPGFSDRPNGFEARRAPSTFALEVKV